MAHARLGIIAVVLAAGVEMTSAQTQTQTESSGRTLWDHNGSIVYLVANGSSREFYYQKTPTRNVGCRSPSWVASIPRTAQPRTNFGNSILF
jgi:hypothetical protein